MGNDLGGGGQRTGKRLMKAKTASVPEATSEEMKQREWKPCAASTGSQCGSQKGRVWKPT